MLNNMSLATYFYDKCPECGGALEEGQNPISGADRIFCPSCKLVYVEGYDDETFSGGDF